MYKSPIAWVGGKFRLAKKLIGLFPEHITYVEVFGGAAHVMFSKEPSSVEIYNDIDDRLVNFFSVVQDPEKCRMLVERLDQTLYSRSVFNRCKNTEAFDDISKAFQFYVLNKQSFGAKMGTWGVDIGGNKQTVAFRNGIDKIKEVFERFTAVQIECSSFEYIIKRYDRPDTFFYLDPPYVFNENRSKTKVYRNEMTNQQHEMLVDLLLEIKGKAMLSGYDNGIYDRLVESGWRRIDVGDSYITVNKNIGEKRMVKQEFVWVNY